MDTPFIYSYSFLSCAINLKYLCEDKNSWENKKLTASLDQIKNPFKEDMKTLVTCILAADRNWRFCLSIKTNTFRPTSNHRERE